jgi:uncharacterized membrane protein
MATYRLSTSDIPQREYTISSLPVEQPMRWLRRGWDDLRARPVFSLSYGVIFALTGFALTNWLIGAGQFWMVPAFAGGFILIAPVLAVGLYAAAKQRNEGTSAGRMRGILRANRSSIGMMGVVLLLVFVNWIMLSNLLFGGVFHELLPTWDRVKPLPVMFYESFPFLAVFGGMGFVLAAIVFRMTAVSIPMLVDQDIDFLNAIFASWKAVGENALPMALWAGLIVALSGVGFLTYYVGLIVVVPWLGYASWHAYRDTLVPRQNQ